MYGTQAIELEDTYLRQARPCELLTFMDSWTGKKHTRWYFLTADHGAGDNVLFSEDHDPSGGNLNFYSCGRFLGKYLQGTIRPGRIHCEQFQHRHLLDHALVTEKKINLQEMQKRMRCISFKCCTGGPV
jgi:hypothetical protein